MAVNAVDAATVILLRDHPQGDLEMLLMRRPEAARAFPGVFVFPGGKVEPSDQQLSQSCWSSRRDLAWWRAELQAPSKHAALGYLVAAIRETFEEAGVLLAHHQDGRPVRREDLDRSSVLAARARLTTREASWDWSSWLESGQFVLDFDALRFWSWWVTPLASPHRFDTRFFVARLPCGQIARHDQQEVIEVRWLPPRGALERFANQSLPLLDPTVRTLAVLAGFDSSDEALSAAAAGQLDRRRNGPPPLPTEGPPTPTSLQRCRTPPGGSP